ncbi:MAG: carbonic anhydrase [Phycisphaerales bacterium]|nr:carbonic anhydrase [Phycisphaerales bacterium]
MKPQAALEQLVSGNARYVEGNLSSSNSPEDRVNLATGQAPIAAIIRCADSRVAPEIVFDQPLGKLFVCGVAGNIPTPEIVESVEYAVGHLGTTLIVVMGHSNCGAVTVALQNEFVDGLFAQIALAPTPDLDDCIANNAEQGIATILARSPMIEEVVKSGEVQIVAGVQDIATGEFELVAQTQLN